MKYFLMLFLVLMLVFNAGCKKDKNLPKEEKTAPEELMQSKDAKSPAKVENPKDSINKNNVVEFLTQYGKENKESRVLIRTRLGTIKIQLFKDTPLHRASFIFLSKMGYFDTTCFYRVVPDFIIQGGESERLDTQRYKARYHRYKIPPEFRSERVHKYGAVAMARDWENNPGKYSTAFEFYIIQNRKGAHHLDGEHTVIGQVVAGFETIDRIVNLKAGSDEWPLDDVFMKIEVID